MQVVILAGWLWTRLSEETTLKPKPMVEIWWKPILWHIMKHYAHYWYNEFIICLGYKGYLIKERFADYFLHNNDITIDIKINQITVHNKHTDDWKVTLIDTWDNTMTGWRISKIKDYIQWNEFMLTYGDGVSDVHIDKLLAFHKSHGKLATITSVAPAGRFWKLWLEGEQIMQFAEKKDNEDSRINGWFMVLNKKIIEYVSWDDMPLEKDPLENLAKEGQLMAYKHSWFRFAMDTLQNKQDLEAMWNSWKAPRKTW